MLGISEIRASVPESEVRLKMIVEEILQKVATAQRVSAG